MNMKLTLITNTQMPRQINMFTIDKQVTTYVNNKAQHMSHQ